MNNKPLFFLHIPRTGGTTVDKIFSNNIHSNNILSIYKDFEYKKYREINSNNLVNIKYITGHLLLSNYNPFMFYNIEVDVFTFLRNPVSRLISEYIFYKTWKDNHLYKIINENNVSFSEYLLSNNNILKYRGKNFMTRCISGKSFIFNKYPYSALAVAKKNIDKKFKFIGILEKFAESIFLLGKIFNLSNIFFEQNNKLRPDLKNCISDNDKDIALELNKADSELYKFAVDIFQERIDKLDNKTIEDIKKFISKNIKNTRYSSCKEIDEIFLPKKY